MFVLCFNHRRIPKGSFPHNFVKIQLDLAEILRISKLDWRDGGGKKEKGRRRRREEGGGEESYFVMVQCNYLCVLWTICVYVRWLLFWIVVLKGTTN